MNTIVIPDTKVEELRDQLDEASLEQSMGYSLADAIREGSTVTGQKCGNWTDETGDNMCALSAAMVACKARRIVT